MKKLGTLYILSAPSGAGKSSLLQAYLKDGTALASKISVSHTTRDPRPGEEHGKHYHFVQQTEFLNMVAQDEFIEYAQVFDNYYGTSKKAIEQELKQGFNVFLDIDWQGAQQVRKQFPKAVSIFILPPSLSELHKRLISRQQDSEEVIKKRMQQAESEISHYPEYDYVIINDEFSVALEHFKAILLAESLKVDSENLWDPQVEDFDQYLNRLKINS